MNGDLTKEQVEELKHILRARFKTLRADIREALVKSDDEKYVELAGLVRDTAEESVADLLSDVNLVLIDNHVKEIRAVEQALIRMGMGSYGVCIDCDENIGYARLKAAPAALRCISCQERYERKADQMAPHATM